MPASTIHQGSIPVLSTGYLPQTMMPSQSNSHPGRGTFSLSQLASAASSLPQSSAVPSSDLRNSEMHMRPHSTGLGNAFPTPPINVTSPQVAMSQPQLSQVPELALRVDEPEDEGPAHGRGTLTIGEDGSARYLGPTAGSEWLRQVSGSSLA